MLTGSSFTNTSIVSDWGAACCRALALVERHLTALRQLPSSRGACLTLLSISTALNFQIRGPSRCAVLLTRTPRGKAQTQGTTLLAGKQLHRTTLHWLYPVSATYSSRDQARHTSARE
jgi:hypothetical protein